MGLSNMITAVDTHAGTPMRLITGGVVDLTGATFFAKMKWLQTEGDELRRRMLREPRGYPAMCCNLILPPSHPKAHLKNAVTMSTGVVDWDRPETWTGAIDRCPCGTGTCAKMAVLQTRGELALDEDFRHEGILGTIFTGRLIEKIH